MIKLNGKTLEFTKFPNGETNVNGEEIYCTSDGFNQVELKYESDDDLIKLMFVKKHLDSYGEEAVLIIRYMPYSRQDRVEGNSVFTLKYISEFINSLGFTHVTIEEPHSDVTMALVNHSYAVYPTIEMLENVKESINFNDDNDYIFYPDAGAYKRYSKLIPATNVLVGFKDRDFATGRIKSLQVVGDTWLTGGKVIIVDDLCSRGGTFVLAAEKLRELDASEVYLLVTHCENTMLEGKILDNNGLIDKVFTTDSILSDGSYNKIHVFKGGLL